MKAFWAFFGIADALTVAEILFFMWVLGTDIRGALILSFFVSVVLCVILLLEGRRPRLAGFSVGFSSFAILVSILIQTKTGEPALEEFLWIGLLIFSFFLFVLGRIALKMKWDALSIFLFGLLGNVAIFGTIQTVIFLDFLYRNGGLSPFPLLFRVLG